MQIKLNLQIFLFIFVFFLTHQIELYVIVLTFAIIHELGHLISGIVLKLKPKELSIMPFGISITFEDYGYKKALEIKKILIALAGPLTNIVIAVFTGLFNINLDLKEMIIYSNILIALFNLIPIYPLDGGRILKSLLRLRISKEKTEHIVHKVSKLIIILLTAISSIAILYLKNIAILFIIIYLWIISIKENKRYNLKSSLYKILQTNNKNIDN